MEWGMEMEQILRLDEKIDENAIAIDFVTSEIKNSEGYLFIKRFLDIIGSLSGLILLFPIMMLVAIAIKIEDPKGKVIFGHMRVGKDGRLFPCLKFRSMFANAEEMKKNFTEEQKREYAETFKLKNDPRITKVGKFIRKTSLDELPQLFNVLIGEMSIIGPRASEWNSLNDYLPEELDKMKVKPGITGYTQAYYRNSLSLRDKRKYDVWYANNMGFLLDTKIFFKTIITVLKKENIYTNTKKRGKL